MTVTEEALGAEPVIAVAERDTLPETGTAQHVTKRAKSAKKKGHFAKYCKTRTVGNQDDQHKRSFQKRGINNVDVDSSDNYDQEYDDEFAFNVHMASNCKYDTIPIIVDKFDVDVNVDIGASVNMIDSKLWEELKGKKI